MATGKTSTARKPKRDRRHSGSQIVAMYVPRNERVINQNPAAEARERFSDAFIDTLEGRGQGLLMAHLYHEPPADNAKQLYGGHAWDAFISEGGAYPVLNSDISTIDRAIKDGMVEFLPANMKLIEYGSGGKSGAEKPAHLIRAIMNSPEHSIGSYIAVDILNRFATESSLEMHEQFNLRSYAVVGDYTIRQKLVIPNGTNTPVVINFGGGLANAPDYSQSDGKNGKENATEYFKQMNRQHGIGSYVLFSYHSENNPEALLEQYACTDALSAFIKSAFVRATQEGVITDPTYDPTTKWKIEPRYDPAINAIAEFAVCQESHVIRTKNKDYEIAEGQSLSAISLSHKWGQKDYVEMLEDAGYEIVRAADYLHATSHRGVLLARVATSPKPR